MKNDNLKSTAPRITNAIRDYETGIDTIESPTQPKRAAFLRYPHERSANRPTICRRRNRGTSHQG